MTQQTVWSFAGASLQCQKTAIFTADGATAPSTAGGASRPAAPVEKAGQDPAKQLQNAEEYLQKHQLQAKVEAAVNEVLTTMPANATEALAEALKKLALAPPPASEAPAQEPVVNQVELEQKIKAQGDVVRAMKEANKAAAGTHSKEEIDAAVAALKELKETLAKASGGGGAEKKAGGDKKKDKKGDAAKGKAGGSYMIDTEPVSGTRDFYPEEMRARNWLFQHFKDVAKGYSFQEYDAPVLEHEELYKRKAGEEITEQMYNFVDKSGHAVTLPLHACVRVSLSLSLSLSVSLSLSLSLSHLHTRVCTRVCVSLYRGGCVSVFLMWGIQQVTLRPEMTPTLARMVLGRTNAESGEVKMVLPVKWFSLPQCWRFETTQRGRKREHYQWNMDIVGVKTIAAEVELLSAITSFFLKVGITAADVGIKINSRKVMASILSAQGISEAQFAPVCVVVDKLDKIGDDAVTEELVALGVGEATARKIIKTMAARSVEELAAQAQGADQEGLDELREVFVMAKEYGFADFLVFDASVVRGLAYYTGIVFECFDRTGELRAICGGGRYDRLLSLYGSKQEVPCVGFGFGDCVIMELLQMKKLLPSFDQRTDFVVAAFNRDMLPNALAVASLLRKAGAAVDMQLEPKKKVGQTFDYANRAGARFIAFVAPDEWAKNMVRIKDLRMEDKDANQKDVALDQLHTWASLFPAA